MGLLTKFFKKKEVILPCKQKGCPYEYEKDSDRDIEGMPFIDGDPRSCPEYGHICPEFMEDLGLTVESLNIRAILHCGGLLDHLFETGKADPEAEENKILKKRYEDTIKKYPKDLYPQLY